MIINQKAPYKSKIAAAFTIDLQPRINTHVLLLCRNREGRLGCLPSNLLAQEPIVVVCFRVCVVRRGHHLLLLVGFVRTVNLLNLLNDELDDEATI